MDTHAPTRLERSAWLILAVIGAGSFLGPLSGSITNVALPALAAHYRTDIQSVKWVVLAYLMVQTFLLPIAGKLGQRYGESRLYRLGFAVYGLGSIACALAAAGPFGVLVGARMLQAVGAALLFAVGGALVTRYIPPQRRGLAFALIGSIVGVALVTGPVLGGWLATWVGWPWVFWALVPVTLAGFILSTVLLTGEAPSAAGRVPLRSSLAWAGLVVGLTLIAEAFSKGLWLDRLWLTAVLTAVAAVVFALMERRADSLFDYSLFRIRSFRAAVTAAILINSVIFPLIVFLPFYLENYRGLPLSSAGLILAISPLATIFASPPSGHLADRYGFRGPILAGLALLTGGYLLAAAAVIRHDLLWLGGSLGLMGVGGGLFAGPNYAALVGSVDPARRSLASSLGSLTRNIGFLAGTSLSALIFGLLLWQYGGPELMLAARAGELAASVPEDAFVYGFSRVLLICAALSALGLILSLRFPNRPQHDEAA